MNAIRFYRLANFLYRSKVPLLPGFVRYLMFLLFNSFIPPQCQIGRGSYFAHGGIGVVLHPDCRIGERVLIGQGVTLGGTFGSGVPVIDDDVWIGPGVRILGDITVGNNSIIGANAVVTKDIEPNSVVGGVPARLIRTIKPGALDVINGKLEDG